MFRGDTINVTENRAVLHVALRAPRGRVDRRRRRATSSPEVHEVLDRMAAFADRVRSGEWKGHTGKRIRNVVNIGIGGSDLGPGDGVRGARATTATARLTFRFVSNVDGTDFAEATRDLDPAETLFIVSSKTFTTLETMTNAHTARDWFARRARRRRRRSRSTSSPSRPTPTKVPEFGIDTANMFGFWDWVGGRYSMDSAIGLSTMLAIGPDSFRAMLAGFHAMDEHFRTAPFEHNLPVLMGLLGVWYSDFFGAQTLAVLPYEQYLKRFPAYLQQLDDGEQRQARDARRRARSTTTRAPIFWGEPGTNGQHALLPADPPGHAAHPVRLHRRSRKSLNPLGDHHDLLIANVFAQAEALAFGKTAERGARPKERRTRSCRTGCSRATARRT